ncbi:MAG: BrnA antitoxin family protein [Mangrovicoccus sp.]|nr:BrnA antitoxin family protein [Mangrovicoccus sp.]
MKANKPYISNGGEVRELDGQFFTNAKRGRPPLPDSKRKQPQRLMLDPDVIERLKSEGSMSATANEILRKALGL